MDRLQKKFEKEIVPALMGELGYKNILEVPRLQKVVLSVCHSEALTNIKVLDNAAKEVALITGQKPRVTKSKKSIANFKLRKGVPLGCSVTLRRQKMYEFVDRLFNVALPRVRDFRGVSPKAFDGHGNYTLGIKEQIIFPEIEFDKVDQFRGMNVTFVTTARTDAEGKAFLQKLGMPFRK